ncbi:MAG: orotidine-5'-phosphate decarboxylase [Aestuariivita sp.]|nr:orotidine-5'-phosphate decarboxylase [Aestuariivita sp.]
MMDDRLIIALDTSDSNAGLRLATTLNDVASFFKIGLGMISTGGLTLAKMLKQEQAKRIFLDLKLFDISATIEAAVRNLSKFDFDFLTVHGDPHVIRAAKEGASGTNLRILAVTILTSLDRNDLNDSLIKEGKVSDLVLERTVRALEAGADGVIASPQEAALIRALPQTEQNLVVTPGIRSKKAKKNDQKRIATPLEAIQNGADHIVVGRPIYQASNPVAITQEILTEIKNIPIRFHQQKIE